MQINKIKTDILEMLSDVFDGATIMVGGFGEAGSPIELLHGLIDSGAKDLTIIANNAGNGKVGLGALIGQRQVKKVICSFARSAKGVTFPDLYNKGEIENHKEDLNVIPLSICDKSSPSRFAHLIENEQIIFLDILFCLA